MPLQRLDQKENTSGLGGFLRWTAATVFCGAVLLGTARRSAAATITVTDPADSGGPNSLRSALVTTNAGAGGDTINFNLPAGTTITLNGTELPVSKAVSITGPGASNLTIDGNNASRLFNVSASTVTISGMTLAHGISNTASGSAGGGVFSSGGLTLDSVTITGCAVSIVGTTASGSTGPKVISKGGAIYAKGPLTLTGCVISGNSATATTSGGDITLPIGGGIFCTNTTNIQNSTISGNSVTAGPTTGGTNGPYSWARAGGVYCYGAISIQNTSISDNTVTAPSTNSKSYAYSGGMTIYAGGSATSTVQNCTISGNRVSCSSSTNLTSSAKAGGIYASCATRGILIQNCTVSGNSVSAFSTGTPISVGGGFRTGGGTTLVPVTLENCTIVNNTLNTASGPGGGINNNLSSTLVLISSLVAKNTRNSATPVSDDLFAQAGSLSGTNNLIGDGTGESDLTNGGNSNQVGTTASPIDPKVGPLQNNGGPTRTHALNLGSPAIDAGINTVDVVNGPGNLTTDQRGSGFPRQVGTAVDIGAFERSSDSIPPTAAIGSAPDVTTSAPQYTFTVVFSDNALVDVNTLANTNILVTGPNGFNQFAQFVSASPKTPNASVTATYMITPPGGAWSLSANGAYTVALQASQVADISGNFATAGTLGNFTVSLLSITSGPTATPNTAGIGGTIQFSAAGSLTGTTFSWDFGDGSTDTSGSANVSHAFASAGTFTVTVTASSGTQSVTGTVTVKINGTAFGTGPDSNGDGFSDAFDTAFGLNPNDPTQSPVPAGTAAGTLTAAKMSIKLNFAKQNSDIFSLSGTLAIPTGFNVNGAKIGISAGDLVEVFTLGSSGKAKTSIGAVIVSIKSTKGSVAAQTAKYAIKLNKVSLAAALLSSGLVNDNVTNKAVTISGSVVLSQADRLVGIVEQGTVSLHYTARKGKSGSAK